MYFIKVPGDLNGVSLHDFLVHEINNKQEVENYLTSEKVRLFPSFSLIKPEDFLTEGKKLVFKKKLPEKGVEVIYDDDEMMLLSKPAGLLCISDDAKKNTLYKYALNHMKMMGEYDVDTLCLPYICNVLPAEMGGLVIIAKNQYLFEQLIMALRERRIKRTFLVAVNGIAKENDLVQGFIQDRKNRGNLVKNEMNRNTRPAALKYRLIDIKDDISLIEVELLSSYKDQIQSLLASAGLPVLGDSRYGNEKLNRKHHIYSEAIWCNRVLFETGVNNYLEYMNNKEISDSELHMPAIGFFRDITDSESKYRIELVNRKQLKQVARIAWMSFSKALSKKYPRDITAEFRSKNKLSALISRYNDENHYIYGYYGKTGLEGIISFSNEGVIDMLYVKPTLFRQGIGTALLKECENILREKNVGRISVNSYTESKEYFLRMGFEITKYDEQNYVTLGKSVEPPFIPEGF